MTASRFVVRFVHARTGAEALDTVEIDLVAHGSAQAAARDEAWKALDDASKRLRPLGYQAQWVRC